jgi:hypothetical protein
MSVSLARRSLAFGKVAHQRKLDHLALESLDNEYNPNHEKREADHHGDQQEEQAAKTRNKEQQEADNPERCSNDQASQTHPQALKGMKTNETVFAIGLDKKKNDRWQKKVGQGASQRLRQCAHDAMCPLGRAHGTTTAWTKRRGIGH